MSVYTLNGGYRGYILPTMPKVSFYLRNEDIEAWKSIQKKTEWIHNNLQEQQERDQPMPEHEMVVYKNTYKAFVDERPTVKRRPKDKPYVIADSHIIPDVKICPHGFPANGWSCKKGCK
jgi:hypothetical protein